LCHTFKSMHSSITHKKLSYRKQELSEEQKVLNPFIIPSIYTIAMNSPLTAI
jgi:hypothetical protein